MSDTYLEVDMSFIRVNIDLAFKQPLSPVVKARLESLRDEIKRAKAYAKKINEGQPNEETTIRGVYHICRHDEGKPCSPEEEI